jgi:molybdopterin-guanine dinucleotide biosynthesis protein A
MLAAVIQSLDTAAVAISANGDPARFAAFGLPVLPDGAFAGQGPLAGILAGLEWAGALGMTALLTAPGDMPFLPAGLARLLSPAPRAVRSGQRAQQLVALWPVDAAGPLRAFLSAPGSRRVSDFAERIGMQYRDFSLGIPEAFVNVNTPQELARAREIAGQTR